MIIVPPKPITESLLEASNVPEDDYAAWDGMAAYVVEDRVIYDHSVYEALAGTTGEQPDLFPLVWLRIGATNRYKMFDSIVSDATVNPETIEVEIKPLATVNAVAVFGAVGQTVNVTVVDDVDGEVYNETKPLQMEISAPNWYAYFFDPIETISDVVFLDLPSYGISASVFVTVDAGMNDAECGECVMGLQTQIGVANFNTSVGIQDYSRKERDEFGNIVIVERAFAKKADYDVTVDTRTASSTQRRLAAYRAKPIVYIGDQNKEETIVYGFYKNFSIIISTPSVSQCSIEVEGLI